MSRAPRSGLVPLSILTAALSLAACSGSGDGGGGGDAPDGGAADGRTASDASDDGVDLVAASHYLPVGLVADATHVYWIDGVDAESRYAEGSVWRVARTGGQPEAIAEHQYSVGGRLAVDDDAVYWVAGGSSREPRGQVMRWAKAGGAPVAIAEDQAQPFDLALAGDHVYFVAYGTVADNNAYNGDGSVRRVPRTGGAVEVLTPASRPTSLAVTADTVFYGSGGVFGGIAQVPRAGGVASEAFAGGWVRGLGDALLVAHDGGLAIVSLTGAPTIAAGDGLVLGIEPDGFLRHDGGPTAGSAIERVGLDGAATELVAGPLRAATAVVTDEGLYYAENPIGTYEASILRVELP